LGQEREMESVAVAAFADSARREGLRGSPRENANRNGIRMPCVSTCLPIRSKVRPENAAMLSTRRLGLVVLVSLLLSRSAAQEVYRIPCGPLPIRPPAEKQDLNEFDRTMLREMQDRGAVGAAIAVTRAGKLIYARGFGYANLQNKEPVQPTSLFRIASISKTITAVAVLQLVQKRKLGLDVAFVDVLKLRPVLEAGREPDSRMRQVTIRHLLNHSGGWDNRSPEGTSQPTRRQARLTCTNRWEVGSLRSSISPSSFLPSMRRVAARSSVREPLTPCLHDRPGFRAWTRASSPNRSTTVLAGTCRTVQQDRRFIMPGACAARQGRSFVVPMA